jgi:hypothetical protein
MGADLSQKAQASKGTLFPFGALRAQVGHYRLFTPQVAVIPLGEEKDMEKYMGKAI